MYVHTCVYIDIREYTSLEAMSLSGQEHILLGILGEDRDVEQRRSELLVDVPSSLSFI